MTEGLTLQMWKIKSTHLNLGRQEILRRVRLGISWTRRPRRKEQIFDEFGETETSHSVLILFSL